MALEQHHLQPASVAHIHVHPATQEYPYIKAFPQQRIHIHSGGKGGKKEKIVLKIFYLWHKILILILIHKKKKKKFFSHYKERGRDRFVAGA